jgi:hypothetical protein
MYENLTENNFYMSNTRIEFIFYLYGAKHLLMPELGGLCLN